MRAYVDIPYAALVLGAILAEARRPRTTLPLILLALAGLLRPEAWLFSFAYVAWRRDLRLLPLAAAAPVLWLVHDQIVTGDWLHSLTDTRDNAETLQRITGLDDVPVTSRAGSARSCASRGCSARRRAGSSCWRSCAGAPALLVAAGFVSIAAFCVLAAAGPADPRPLPARAGRDPGRLLRRRRVRLAAAAAGPPVAQALGDDRRRRARRVRDLRARARPSRIGDLRDSMGTQSEILADLHSIVGARSACRAGRRPEPPPGPAHRAVDRTSRRARSSPRSSSSPRRASTSTPRRSACCATSRSTRATRSA